MVDSVSQTFDYLDKQEAALLKAWESVPPYPTTIQECHQAETLARAINHVRKCKWMLLHPNQQYGNK